MVRQCPWNTCSLDASPCSLVRAHHCAQQGVVTWAASWLYSQHQMTAKTGHAERDSCPDRQANTRARMSAHAKKWRYFTQKPASPFPLCVPVVENFVSRGR
eukprot:1158858-Pelagomonas_calceolata.AAC.9